ncbi:hypothetical protein ACFQS7_08185 [Dankookia sp. GCM10030260]|uniref:hypothetical protein n=1 Tax=Dankookia sp. GCM10030260 TaxID=3273390 RepID=UPI00360A499B
MLDLDPGHADRAGLSADTSPDEDGPAAILQLHDLGQVGAERVAEQATGFGQDLVQVFGFRRELAEWRQRRLLPQQRPAFVLAGAGAIIRTIAP